MRIFGKIGAIKKAMRDREIKKAKSDEDKLKRIKLERIEYEKRAKVKSDLRQERKQLFQAKNPIATNIAKGVRANFEKARAENKKKMESSSPYWIQDTGNPFNKGSKKKKEDNKPYWLK